MYLPVIDNEFVQSSTWVSMPITLAISGIISPYSLNASKSFMRSIMLTKSSFFLFSGLKNNLLLILNEIRLIKMIEFTYFYMDFQINTRNTEYLDSQFFCNIFLFMCRTERIYLCLAGNINTSFGYIKQVELPL